MHPLLRRAYDPEFFRSSGHELVDMLAEWLEAAYRREGKVLRYESPESVLARWRAAMSRRAAHPRDFFRAYVEETIHLHHPYYLGHQTGVVAPVAALAELVGALLDPGMGVYEQGNVGVVWERLLVRELAARFGMDPDRADGFFTSGGTLGNLTALLCARQQKAGGDIWTDGYGGRQYGFMVSEEAHYSVARAIQVMGMGARGVVRVPTDAQGRMRTELLERVLGQARAQGIEVIGLVANACTTALGVYDPLDVLADFCARHDLWLHVDGAHGAAVAFSARHRHRLRGIERADSVIMDFHKMLMTPTLVTAVVFRRGEDSFRTFVQKASYLWAEDETAEWYHLAKRTYELTKQSMSVRVMALWQLFGPELFAAHVDHLYALARRCHELLQRAPDFETALPEPQSNILCYRMRPEGVPDDRLDALNAALRHRLVQEGDFFIVQTRWRGRLWLRSTLINPMTAEADFAHMLDRLRALAAEQVGS